MNKEFSKKELVGIFKEEFEERTTLISNAMLEDETLSDENLAVILREIHGLKGSSRMVGLDKISETVHKWEDLFKEIQKKELEFSDDILNISLMVIDSLEENLLKMQTEDNVDEDYLIVINEIQRIIGKGAEKPKIKKDKVKKISKNKVTNPESKEKRVSTSDIEEKITISTRKIDRLRGFLEEIIINDNFYQNLEQRLKYFEFIVKDRNIGVALNNDLKETIKLLETQNNKNRYFIKTLKEEVLSLKMIPIKHLIAGFPRMVHDISNELNKKVDFEIINSDTELEVEIFNKLKAPLLHIIRNSIDHGIESSEVRKKRGKLPRGKILLSFEKTPDYVIVKIKDDGNGLDKKMIIDTAKSNGILDKNVKNMSDSEIYSLIFNMGFSTKKETSDISGRGIGMNVVDEVINKELKGKVEIVNKPKEGLTFILSIPTSLTIINVVTFIASDQFYALQIDAVSEVQKLSAFRVKKMKEQRYIEFNDNLIPIFSFLSFLSAGHNKNEKYLIIINFNFHKFGLLVDNIVNQKEVVIKKMNFPLNKSKLFQGAFLYDNERLVPLLNPDYFYENQHLTVNLHEKKKTGKRGKKILNVLVVDDSFTTRGIEISILQDLNANTFPASSGVEALDVLKKNKIDLIISDVQMPEMDGIEFIKHVQKNPKWKDIPFIFVSTTNEEDLGVNKAWYHKFIRKRDFSVTTVKSILDNL